MAGFAGLYRALLKKESEYIMTGQLYKYTNDELRTLWASAKSLDFNGKKYYLGRMSYGDYFLEPGEPKGETEGFRNGTIWPEREKNTWSFII